jgi:hypothetical protein
LYAVFQPRHAAVGRMSCTVKRALSMACTQVLRRSTFRSCTSCYVCCVFQKAQPGIRSLRGERRERLRRKGSGSAGVIVAFIHRGSFPFLLSFSRPWLFRPFSSSLLHSSCSDALAHKDKWDVGPEGIHVHTSQPSSFQPQSPLPTTTARSCASLLAGSSAVSLSLLDSPISIFVSRRPHPLPLLIQK